MAVPIFPFGRCVVKMKKIVSIFLSISLIWWNLSFAAPEGGVVVGGNAAIAQSGTTTTINQTSQNAVINWQGFDLASNEAAHFIQPNSSASALNRITSGLPTSIAGTVTANGNVFFVNPAGILFTNTSRIDVGGILATTANIQNQDFMNGNYHFTGDPNSTSSVINNGAIKAQQLAALVAPNVENNGVITANMGKVLLGSGAEYTLDMYGDNLINFSASNAVKTSVKNNGQIYADGGKVLLTAKAAANVVDNVIGMDGMIQANTVSQKNGSIILGGGDSGVVSVTGKMSAHTVKVLGHKVAVTGNAKINSDGGEVLIGGNYRGEGPEPNAAQTYFGPDATIDVGDGRVIVWGTDTMQAYGTINAPGGFVETSGGWFDVSGIKVNANQWLLDPAFLFICDSSNCPGGGSSNIYPGTFAPNEEVLVSYLHTADFVPTLNAGGSVTITTIPPTFVQPPAVPGAGSIRIMAPITKTSGGDATLNIYSVGDLQFVGGSITSTSGKLNVNLTAAGGILDFANINTNGGNVSLTASGDITDTFGFSAAAISANTLTTNSGGSTYIYGSQQQVNNFNGTAGGNIVLDNGAPLGTLTITGLSVGGNVSVTNNGAIQFSGGSSSVTGNLTVLSNGVIVQSNLISVGGTSAFITRGAATGAIILNDSGNQFTGSVGLSNVGNSNPVSLVNSSLLIMDSSSLGTGTLDLVGAGITQTGAIVQAAGAGAITLTTTAPGTDILLGSQANDFSGTINFGGTLTNIRDVALRSIDTSASIPSLAGLTNLRNLTLQFDNAAIALPMLSNSGNLSVTAGGAITPAGALTVNGAASFSSGSSIVLNNPSNAFAGTVSVNTTGANDVSLTNSLATQFDTSSVGGSLTVNSGGAVTQLGAFTVAGASSFSAGADFIYLSNFSNIFTGAVSLNTTGVNNAAINASYTTPLIFNTSNIGGNFYATNGSFIANTAGGDIQQIGPLHVGGSAVFNMTSNYSSGGGNITLTDPSNTFGGYVYLYTGNPFGGAPLVAKNASLTAASNVFLGRFTIVHGDLNVTTTNGGIYQQDNLDAQQGVAVTGTATFNAGNNEINLGYAEPGLSLGGNPFNNFIGPVIFNNTGASNNVRFINPHATILGASNVGGNLTVTTGTTSNPNGGAITQIGALTIGGTSSFNSGASSITLDNFGNLFTGAVSVDTASDALIDASLAQALMFDTSTIGGNYTVNSGAFTQTGVLTVGGSSVINTSNNSAALGTSNIGGNYTVSSGALTQTGVLTVGGSSVINTGNNSAALGTSNIGGNYTVNSGVLTQTGVLTVGGSSVINTGNNSAALGTSNIGGNYTVNSGVLTQTGVLTVGGSSVINTGNNAVALGTSNIGGNYTVNSGALTQTGVLTVGGSALINTGNNAVALGTSNIGRNYTVNSGAITQTGALSVAGSTTVNTGNNSAVLTNAANHLVGSLFLTGNNANVFNSIGINVGGTNIANNLMLTALGIISQTGAIHAANLITSSIGGTNLNNPFNAPLVFNATNVGGGDILFANQDPLAVSGIAQSGGGSIHVNGAQPINIVGNVISDGGSIWFLANDRFHTITVDGLVSSGSGSGGDLFKSGRVTINGTIKLGAGNIIFNSPVEAVDTQKDNWWDTYSGQYAMGAVCPSIQVIGLAKEGLDEQYLDREVSC